ncbi:related to ire1-protein kinase [Phaffia rhodozyma]|uniref:non-specific serine/threonine protein kinase n=1 Tax=Phaffia rhodozyma TaxID=264483 RepID=A0A0F7SMY1_PHARH|nr:related to ire1-protein kinase [Phaffia rhodozyma]
MIAESESKKTERELVVSDKLIGVGSHGTMVFEGTFQSRPVAVKRVLSHFTTLATQEINLLQSSDHHPNIIRYFYQETSDPWLFIALELCPASLEDLFTKHREVKELRDKLIPKDALRDIFGGVRHLHGLKIIHRDIKPPNILVSLTAKGLKMLISDFGLAKQTTLDQSSFGGTVLSSSITHLAPTGTTGWRAPEVLLHRGTESESSGDASSWDDWDVVRTGKGAATSAGLKQISKRLTSAVDVFSLGCLTYWLLTRGGHPFGERMERDRNICKGRSQLNGLPLSEEECSEARDLVSKMISQDSSNRPSVDEAFLHPYFWSPARKLSFLQDASDRFEIFVRDPPDPMLQLLENGSTKVIGSPRDWMRLMDQSFVDSLGKYRKYDVGSLRDLLRALRNKRHHYLDLPAAAREAMSPLPEGFLAYFTKRFPLLFLHVYGVISSTELRDEGGFREYFLDGER